MLHTNAFTLSYNSTVHTRKNTNTDNHTFCAFTDGYRWKWMDGIISAMVNALLSFFFPFNGLHYRVFFCVFLCAIEKETNTIEGIGEWAFGGGGCEWCEWLDGSGHRFLSFFFLAKWWTWSMLMAQCNGSQGTEENRLWQWHWKINGVLYTWTLENVCPHNNGRRDCTTVNGRSRNQVQAWKIKSKLLGIRCTTTSGWWPTKTSNKTRHSRREQTDRTDPHKHK